MRLIKFKVWNKRTKKMHGPFTIPELCKGAATTGVAIDDTNLVFLQYTGLQDQAEVDIYEGDIIDNEGAQQKYEVMFYKGAFLINRGGLGYHLFNEKKVVVLGNIYQHQELIQSE